MSIELQSRIYQIRESAIKNNFQNEDLLSLVKDCISQNADKELLHQLLDIAHLSTVSVYFHKTKQIDRKNTTQNKKIAPKNFESTKSFDEISNEIFRDLVS